MVSENFQPGREANVVRAPLVPRPAFGRTEAKRGCPPPLPRQCRTEFRVIVRRQLKPPVLPIPRRPCLLGRREAVRRRRHEFPPDAARPVRPQQHHLRPPVRRDPAQPPQPHPPAQRRRSLRGRPTTAAPPHRRTARVRPGPPEPARKSARIRRACKRRQAPAPGILPGEGAGIRQPTRKSAADRSKPGVILAKISDATPPMPSGS